MLMDLLRRLLTCPGDRNSVPTNSRAVTNWLVYPAASHLAQPGRMFSPPNARICWAAQRDGSGLATRCAPSDVESRAAGL